MDKPKKIKDNPSISKISNQIESFDAITKLSPIIQKILPKTEPLFKQFNEIKKQAKIFDMPDNFNERFADLGWLAYESMNIDIMEKAIKIFDLDGKHTAEQFLTDYVENDKERKLIDNWRPRATFDISYLPSKRIAKELPKDTPERAVSEFIKN